MSVVLLPFEKSKIMIKHILSICLFCIVSIGLNGQSDVPDVTSTFAIKNANVVVRPGQTIEGATVIIKDGLIDRVGANIQIPFDAEVIDADSMFVYAGFIAGVSHVGIPKKEEKGGNSSSERVKGYDPPNDAAGITPEKTVRSAIKATDGSIAAMRKLGFTIAHVIPRGGMMSGKGSLISLAGGSVDELLIQEDMSLSGSLTPAKRRIYPSTAIGVMSKWREMYQQAELAKSHEATFKSTPSGVKRPIYDASTKALYDVTSKSIPVFFHAPKTLDLTRGMALQKDLGFNLVASNVKQAYKLKDKIKSQNIPVVISLNLPKEEKENKKDKEKSDKKEKKEDEMSDEMKKLLERSKAAKKEYASQAASLEKANIPFSISLTDVKSSEIKKNLGRMIKQGLSEESALAALTTNPAKLLGISSIAGTIERGKVANLIVTDTTYFKEKANVTYVFVDGKKFKQEIKEKKKKKEGDPDAEIVLEGDWTLSIDADGMTIGGNVTIEKTDDGYTGTMTTDMDDEETEFDSVEVDGSNVVIMMTADVNGVQAPIKIDVVVEGSDMEGTVNIANGMMTAEVSGSKDDNP